MRALSIIDTALWDRNARVANLPLYKYLGAASEVSVSAYGSGGYYLKGKTPEMLGEVMASYVELGLRAVKMKVGRDDPRSDAERVAGRTRSNGPDILLTLDANDAWSDCADCNAPCGAVRTLPPASR
jgi:L-alanine-DL-glutamate epimerase-like enolase superfamily enzyme